MSMIAGSEVKMGMIGNCIIEPMKKIMMVPYGSAPKNTLSKIKIQEDFLKVGNEYIVSTRIRSEKNATKLIKQRLKLIGCYPEHYLFISDKGIKYSFTKRDYYLKEWSYKEVV